MYSVFVAGYIPRCPHKMMTYPGLGLPKRSPKRQQETRWSRDVVTPVGLAHA